MSLKRGRPAPKLNRACMLCGMVQSMNVSLHTAYLKIEKKNIY